MSIRPTTNFENLQTTSIYQHEQIKSESVNNLLKGICSYSTYINSDLDLSISVDVEKNKVYAVLTPGIYVQDNTMINFKDRMSEVAIGENINLSLFVGSSSKGRSYFVISEYYHGTISDTVNSRPTYATLYTCTNLNSVLTENTSAVPIYKITCLDDYSKNFKVERLVPSLKYNGCGYPDPIYYTEEENLPVFGDSTSDRSELDSIIWALVI